MARSPAMPVGAPPPATPARRTHRKAAPSVPDPDAMRLAIQSATGGKIYQWEQEARKEAQAAITASNVEEPLTSAGGARRPSRSGGVPVTPRQKPVKATVAPKELASDNAAAASRETSTPAASIAPEKPALASLPKVHRVESVVPAPAVKKLKLPVPAAQRWRKENITTETVTGHLMRVSVWRQQLRPAETSSSPPPLQIS
ncbi:hypothetical protein BDZ88DRAFT_420371 [Geranomyces variabilis]|nr:hypothetical protein BDZ88DRAFT_420371 [Geranomyces variabilis]